MTSNQTAVVLDEDDVYDSTAEVAEYFGTSTKTIRRWGKDPDLDFPEPIKIRGRDYHHRPEYRAWAKRQRG